MKAPPCTAQDLLNALAFRHSLDIFVTECKNGPTQWGTHRRLDAWAMLRTWSPITMIGYEIKVNRSDWLQDRKIVEYLPLCHKLYVVASVGVVEVEELPDDIGLIELVGHSLITRHKATFRKILLPGELMVYVLMCRTKITRDVHGTG